MEKRYQVFVSSTFRDLEAERQEVMQALLELDCIPSGMELFPATSDTQWALIERVISECDYYVLIVAGRYGTTDGDGVSYTEREYRCADSLGKPVIAFIHRNPGGIIADKTEQSSEGKSKLEAFRTHIEQKLCKHWSTPQDLGSVVSRSLVQLIKSRPATGWVRADQLSDQNTAEILQLRRRLEVAQQQLADLSTSAPKGSEHLAQGEDIFYLGYHISFLNSHVGILASADWNAKTNWNEIFGTIAPTMIDETDENSIKATLGRLVTGKEARAISKAIERDERLKGVNRHEVIINTDDFQTIKIQLRSLGLITRSERARSVKSQGTYWTLTPYGDEIMTRLRAIRVEQA